jgi:SsrA-binding protein
MPTLATNRDAHHKYAILETLEAGIRLTGAEVKSAKLGNVSLKGSYATLQGNELWLLNLHIGAYKPAGATNLTATRSRKLLVKRSEIDKMIGTLKSAGVTLVPLSLYSKRGLVKVELGLGRGKGKKDKRDTIKRREVERRIGRAMRVKE